MHKGELHRYEIEVSRSGRSYGRLHTWIEIEAESEQVARQMVLNTNDAVYNSLQNADWEYEYDHVSGSRPAVLRSKVLAYLKKTTTI